MVEVLRSPPHESIGPRSVDPESLEPGKSAAVGEDAEQAQDLGMDVSRCRYDAGEEGEGRLPRSVGLAVFMDLCAGHVFQSSVGISIAELAISANIHHMISNEHMDHSDVDAEVLVSTQVCVLDQYIPLSRGAVRHANLGKLGRGVG